MISMCFAMTLSANMSIHTSSHHAGYDAPVGSLERRLLRRSIRLHPQLYRSLGLSAAEDSHVRKSGSLVVAWTPEQGECSE